MEGTVDEVYINDLDFHVAAFWWALVHRPNDLRSRIEQVPITIEEWKGQQTILRMGETVSRSRAALAFFYLNRTNRSGVVRTGGPIGGMNQSGDYSLAARFNKQGLADRIAKLAEFRSHIHVSRRDGVEAARDWLRRPGTFVYLDPPYFGESGRLYTTTFSRLRDHEVLRDMLIDADSESWLLSYDNHPSAFEVFGDKRLAMYGAVTTHSLNRQASLKGHEILICRRGSAVDLALAELGDGRSPLPGPRVAALS